ncbi:MAG: DUF92 domain-containing protein, partial [Acidobacteriota bacterium]|nr:DUF92 domain-containing protein [Acidobacteriota bacterium]
MLSRVFEPTISLIPAVRVRRVFQITLVIPALLLFSISWQETALLAVLVLLFELYVLPALVPDFAKDPGAPPSSRGLLLFPVAILILTLVFRHALDVVAAAWALVTLGDGVAGVCGEAWGRHPLPFNHEKSWEGFGAFIIAGWAGAFVLFLWTNARMPGLKPFLICLAAAIAGAFAESLPIRLDDNITVPLIAGGFLFCAALIERASLHSNLPYLGLRSILAIVVSLAFALVARGLGQITASGAAAGFLLSVAIYMSFGYKSFLVLLCFFVLGTAATRMGYERKRARGIA